jgi:PAS domain S-box-containing protein
VTATPDLHTLSRDLDALNRRVAGLRSARLPSGEGDASVLDAALLELDTAEEELRACHEEIAAASEQIAYRSSRHEGERHLLRQVFRHVPAGLFVLDGNGAVRQANPRAADLAGTPLEFLAGKPMPVLLDMSARAPFRSQLAAVLRSGRGSVLSCKLSGRGHPVDVQLVLSRLTGADSSRPLALATAWAGPSAAEPTSRGLPKPGQVSAMLDGSLRLELMSRMTRLLLEEADGSRVLPAATQLLIADHADWAIADLVRDGKLDRQAVAGARGPFTTAEPDSAVVRDVIAGHGPVVLDPVEDEDAFGRTPLGAPILAAARARSLVSVPIPGLAAGDAVAGVLTVIRRDGRRGFSLADAALLTEIAAHISIALSARGVLDR